MKKEDLRIVFMGTPEFAVPSLKILSENGYNIVGVITAPDKKAGRGQTMHMSDVKKFALTLNVPILQPTNLKDPEFIDELKALNANLQIVVAFRMLPEVVWDMPEIGTFNLHGSLLPNYRGAAPINWAIINGEQKTGVTTFFLQHKIDTGDILFREEEEIRYEDTVGTLYERLMHKGADLVLKTVQAIVNGSAKAIPQELTGNEKPAPKIFKETCEIDWNQKGENLYNFVRGLSPYPVARTMMDGKILKIHKVAFLDEAPTGEPGTIESDDKTYLHYHCADGKISVLELQMEGKKRMDIESFLRGYKIQQAH